MFRSLVQSFCRTHLIPWKQALNQLLWNNQFLRIGGEPIFNKTLFSKGLIALANILTNTGSLKPWTFFKAKGLNANDYLLLFDLFNSFPPAWKRLISSNDKISPDTLANTSADSHNTNFSYTLHLKDGSLPLDSITSSKLYWTLIEIIQVYPSARHKLAPCFRIVMILIGKWSIKFLMLSRLTQKQEFFSINY